MKSNIDILREFSEMGSRHIFIASGKWMEGHIDNVKETFVVFVSVNVFEAGGTQIVEIPIDSIDLNSLSFSDDDFSRQVRFRQPRWVETSGKWEFKDVLW